MKMVSYNVYHEYNGILSWLTLFTQQTFEREKL